MAPARTPLIAGNWKMNGLRADARAWAASARRAAEASAHDVALFPPFPWLVDVLEVVGGADGPVAVGGQCCHREAAGAHTGWTSAAMLADLGCRYVLCGHSERRRLAGEDDEAVAGQMAQALAAGLVPVLCVGERREEREGGRAREVVLRQLDAGLGALRGPDDALVVAYEPVGAIGTGLTASPAEASEAHGWIRARLAETDADRAEGLRILYGGSVKPGNMADLLAASDVDGGLVGGASLDPEAFASIVEASPSPDATP